MSEHHITIQQKREIIRRAHGRCEYCKNQLRFTNQAFSIEHIIPKNQDGQSTPDNLALSCQSCNNHKYTKTTGLDPITGEEAPLFNPHQQRWDDHFAWNDDCTLIIGLTPTGHATVETLKLNKPGLVNGYDYPDVHAIAQSEPYPSTMGSLALLCCFYNSRYD
ncbi:MAG: HNH endonuclease [Anaerolineae bacterium]|nr:HNH endonuclease [Anaerolineae bacterium]